MTYRVVQWSTGNVGRHAIAGGRGLVTPRRSPPVLLLAAGGAVQGPA
jgi:hypothetical protein